MQHEKEQLKLWLKTKINENDLIFDKCADSFEYILFKLKEAELDLHTDNNVLMIKLCNFLYKNSK